MSGEAIYGLCVVAALLVVMVGRAFVRVIGEHMAEGERE